jgi:phospholipid/cholesterol/gamma-HCH transport system substrate-binding protein
MKLSLPPRGARHAGRKRGPDRKAAWRFLVFAVVTISLSVYMAFDIVGTSLTSTYSLVARFDDVSGLKSGDVVKIDGAPVGRVDSVAVVRGRAVVRMSVGREIRMPVDSQAVIRWRNLIGQREVYLEPGQSDSLLRDGAEVMHTQSTVDLGAVINSLGPLTGSLDPKELNQILQTFSVALSGNQGNINQITGNLSLLLTTFGSRSATIDQMIKDYKTVTDAVAARNIEIGQTVQNLETLTQAFGSNAGVLNTALLQLNRFTGNVNAVAGGKVQQLDEIVGSTKKLLEIAHQRMTLLAGIVNGLPTALQALLTTLDGGHFNRAALVCLNLTFSATCPFKDSLPPPAAAGGSGTAGTPAKLSPQDQATFGKLATLFLIGTTQGGQ